MRDIHFRAWDKVSKQMGEVDEINFKEKIIWFRWYKSKTRQGYYQIPVLDVELMQFTGLKDKNGKEIYEGDIVKLYETEYVETDFTPHIYKVVFNVPLFQLEADIFMDGIKMGKATSNMVHCPLEVIGNIYENPELLK